MSFFNDLWKKLNPPIAREDGDETVTIEQKISSPPTQNKNTIIDENLRKKTESLLNQSSTFLKNTEEILKVFHDIEVEAEQEKKVFSNLKALKEIVDQPKEEMPEVRFFQVKHHLGTPESHETVRQERWQDKIRCPNCQSHQVKRLPPKKLETPENRRYQCLACGTEFNDDSDTPLEKGIPPLNIWMLCWYLMGCTDSVAYIANKLNLDLGVVKIMMEQLKKTFNAEKPLTRFMPFDEWNNQAKGLRKQLQEDLIEQHERLNANIATVPKDTAEFRRQQNLRRTLDSSSNPTPSTPGAKNRK